MGGILEICCDINEDKKLKDHRFDKLYKKIESIETIEKRERNEMKKEQENQVCKIYQNEEEEQFYEIEEEKIVEINTKKEQKKNQIKKLKVIGLLGEGSFGKVYLVKKLSKSNKEQELYAMKEISRQITKSKKIMECIKLERKVLENRESLFIVSLKYAFATRNKLYMIMQYAQGGDTTRITKGDLKKKIKQRQQQVIRFVMACVVCGLQQLHLMKIVYRDLKPQNILIFNNGYVKLSDFGLAKYLQGDQKGKTIAGTQIYNAPQIIMGNGYDKAIDIWCLGVLLYELSTSQTPFRLQDVSSKLRFKRITKQEQINKKWRGHILDQVKKDLIASLLKFEAQQRRGYRDIEEIKQHKYFQGIKWQCLKKEQMESPLKEFIENKEFEYIRVKERQKSNISVYSKESWDYKREGLIENTKEQEK